MNRRIRRLNRDAFGAPGDAFVALERNPQVITAACLTILTIVAVCVALYMARAYVMPIATAFVFAVVLAPICGRMEKLYIPKAISAALALILFSGVLYAGFSVVAAPAARWIEDAPQTLQKAEKQLRKVREPLKTVTDISHEMEGLALTPAAPKNRTVIVQGPELTQSLLASAQIIAIQSGFVLVLTYFFLITREEIRIKLIAFQPKLANRVRTARAFRDAETRVTGYLIVMSIINVTAGAAVGLACWRLGLPESAMWGGICAILNFVPYLGPAIAIALLGLAGLSTFDTLIEASFPVIAFLVISFVESSIVTPLVMSRRMTLNPLAIMLAVSFWTWIWGPVGGLISLPLLIMLKVVCDHTPALRAVGSLIGAPLIRNHARKGGWFADRKKVENSPAPAIAESPPAMEPEPPVTALAS